MVRDDRLCHLAGTRREECEAAALCTNLNSEVAPSELCACSGPASDFAPSACPNRSFAAGARLTSHGTEAVARMNQQGRTSISLSRLKCSHGRLPHFDFA